MLPVICLSKVSFVLAISCKLELSLVKGAAYDEISAALVIF